jgi:hypothetical protein
VETAVARRGGQHPQQRLFGGPDLNPYDRPPVKQANGSWEGFGTISPFQLNFPRTVKISLKLFF